MRLVFYSAELFIVECVYLGSSVLVLWMIWGCMPNYFPAKINLNQLQFLFMRELFLFFVSDPRIFSRSQASGRAGAKNNFPH